jgi:hypothetical protein
VKQSWTRPCSLGAVPDDVDVLDYFKLAQHLTAKDVIVVLLLGDILHISIAHCTVAQGATRQYTVLNLTANPCDNTHSAHIAAMCTR